jgi:hypothetical protein
MAESKRILIAENNPSVRRTLRKLVNRWGFSAAEAADGQTECSSPLLFKRLREEIVRLKDEGRVLMRFNELRETLLPRLSGQGARFADHELKAVVGLLAGPGVVWELKFGSWVLLQPERINAHAQAVIQTMRQDEHERGCIAEERILSADLTYRSSVQRLGADEERFVLLAMHQTLVERGLCLREHTEHGPLLIFPSLCLPKTPNAGKTLEFYESAP